MDTTNTQINEQIHTLEEEIRAKKKQLAELRNLTPAEEGPDYTFTAHDGSVVKLSEMFGNKGELILVYNMGKGCRYCTLWADGFIGLTQHLENRAAFALVSPDKPEVQKEFAESRGWNFNMYSHAGNTFAADMGMKNEEKGYYQPGVAVFTKDLDGYIYRRSQTYFGPGDNYNVMWDLMDLLPDGYNNWQPQYTYN